jgi:LexA DNA binding domain
MSPAARRPRPDSVQPLRSDELTRTFAGETVAEIHVSSSLVEVRFVSGRAFVIQQRAPESGRESAAPGQRAARGPRAPGQPTPRQREYLEFIVRYMARYGVAPAESDIAQHFTVSGPSAHQMISTLEKRGFISRGFDIFKGQAASRSLRVLVEL